MTQNETGRLAEALQGSGYEESTLQSLMKNVPGGIIMYRWDGEKLHTLHMSEYYAKRYGESLFDSGDGTDGPDFSRVHPDDREAFQKAIREAMHGSGQLEYVYRMWDFSEKRYFWTKLSGTAERQADGTYLCYAMYTDVNAQQESIERERLLHHCLQLMVDDTHVEENLSEVMRLVLQQYAAERSYIFEFDWEQDRMSNTYEQVGKDVLPEIDNLKNVPIDTVICWVDAFLRGDSVYIDDLEAIRHDPRRKAEYEILKPQGIHQLMVIPIVKNGFLYGYVGVDNPAAHRTDKAFLESIAGILSQEFFNRAQQKKLYALSYQDPLTGLNNRHAFDRQVEAIMEHEPAALGVMFADVNGLKYMNDHYGHREGDRLICRTAEVLKEHFPKEEIYRISGDEFVIISDRIAEEDFLAKAEQLRQNVQKRYHNIFACGSVWKQTGDGIFDMLKEAEDDMYVKKRAFHEAEPMKSRR